MTRPTPFLDLEGWFNFRDLGGHHTTDGNIIRDRQLYRGDALHRLTSAGRFGYNQLGITTVIDLRTDEEVSERRWTPPEHWMGRWLHRPLRTTVPDWTRTEPERAASTALALEHYQETVIAGAKVLVDVLTELALPGVFHCAAGKDRTGIVAAFLLRLLGVSTEDVSQDYALSEDATARWEASIGSGVPDDTQTSWSYVPPAMMTADAGVMRALLHWVDTEYESVARFLDQHKLDKNVRLHLREQLLRRTPLDAERSKATR